MTTGRACRCRRRRSDTGMGLERIVAVLQETLSNYDTDLFTPLLTAIGERAGTPYGPLTGRASTNTSDVSLRVIADHLRAMTFLIADGGRPLQRMARVRAAKDHAACDASWKEAGDRRAVPVRTLRRRHRRDGPCLSGAPGEPRDDRLGRAARGGTVRQGTDRRPAAPGSGARRGGGRARASSPATPRSGCTTRTASRSTSSRIWPRPEGCRWSAADFDQAMEAQRARARAGAAFGDGHAIAAGPYIDHRRGGPALWRSSVRRLRHDQQPHVRHPPVPARRRRHGAHRHR